MRWLKRPRTIVLAIGVLVGIGLGAWWALSHWVAPPTVPGIAAIGEDAALADLWASSTGSSSELDRTSGAAPDDEAETAGLGLVRERGRLVLEIDGDRMGEEVYQLSHRPDDDGYELASRGRFSLKVWFTTLSFDYTQRIQLDAEFGPQQYWFDLNGPLGVGNRHIRADVRDRQAHIETGQSSQTVSLSDGPVAFIGVLASYAFTPKLLGDHDEQRLTAVVFDVRRAEPSNGDAVPTVPLDVTRTGSARLDSVAQERAIEAARYQLELLGESDAALTMYAQDGSFLGLTGRFSEDAPPFRIYRADRLPGGFTIAAAP